jgi:hypothetical protein
VAKAITGVWVLSDDQPPRRVTMDDMMTEIISGKYHSGLICNPVALGRRYFTPRDADSVVVFCQSSV